MADIIDACEAITAAISGLDLESYRSNRLVRSSVEREFIIIGEAISALSHRSTGLFDEIGRARRIIDFRNQLTHEYPNVVDSIVWAIADRDVPILCEECRALMSGFEADD